MQTTEQLELVRRISALEKEVKELHAVEGPLARIGFQVSMAANQSAIVVGAAADVEYDTIAWEYGDGFNIGTHTWTSPIAGVYLSVATIRLQDVDSAATRIEFRNVTTARTFRDEMSPIGLDQDTDFWVMKIPHIVRLGAGGTMVCDINITGGANQTDIVSGTGTRWMCWLIG